MNVKKICVMCNTLCETGMLTTPNAGVDKDAHLQDVMMFVVLSSQLKNAYAEKHDHIYENICKSVKEKMLPLIDRLYNTCQLNSAAIQIMGLLKRELGGKTPLGNTEETKG